MKATVSGVVDDLKFKILEGSDPNWCFPDSAQLANTVEDGQKIIKKKFGWLQQRRANVL